MSKSLLSGLLASCGLSAAAAATAENLASGKPGMSAEDQTAGTASLEALVEAAHTRGMAEGRTAERERFGAVLTNPETVGKNGLAISLLSTTDLPADTIMSNLKAAPSAAETVKPADPPAGAGATGGKPQQQAGDPLAPKDTIEQETPLVDTGAGQTEGLADEAQIASMWSGAMASVQTGGVTAGGVWDFMGNNGRAN